MRSLTALICILFAIDPASAEPFRGTLTSAAGNINLEHWSVAGKDVTPDCDAAWSVSRSRLRGGKQDGVDVVTLDNGRLSIVVVPTRGMGIWSVTMGDVRVGWDSPVKEIVHPKFVSLPSRGGLGWLDGFGEWLCRCGLENNGLPGIDTIIDNTGATAQVSLTLHGKIAYLPAQEVELIVEKAPPYRITLRGSVAERMMFGPNLELRTEISTEPGSNTFRITDEIVNHAAQPAEFQLIYHTNFGPPLLEEGAEFVGPVKRVAPRDARAAEGGVKNFARYAGPKTGFVEQVYFLDLYGDADGRTEIMLRNRAKDRAVSIAYSLTALPYFTIWKNTSAEADGYVTGFEPGTNYPNARSIERKAGRVPKLAPGASRRMDLDITIHADQDAVTRAAMRIEKIQAGRPTTVADHPADGGS